MELDILNKVTTLNLAQSVDIFGVMRIPIILLIAGIFFYSLMLSSKIKILRDTIELEGSGRVRTLVTLNLLLTLFIAILGIIIVIR